MGNLPMRRRRFLPRKDDREGLVGPDGQWWGPDRVQVWCAARMAHFDRLRREARDLINDNGTLKPDQIKTSGRAYGAYLDAYRPNAKDNHRRLRPD